MQFFKKLGFLFFILAIICAEGELAFPNNSEPTQQNSDAITAINFYDYSLSNSLFGREKEENENVVKHIITSYKIASNKYFETKMNFIFLQMPECNKVISPHLIDLPPPSDN